MERLIFHVDVNSAFLSWEAARRAAEGQEDIRLIPAAIGGDRDKRTGVILAKSIPAKKYGVKTGEPVSMALRKCPGLFLAKPDFGLYETCSRAFMSVCRSYAPVVEKYSIDECFLDMSGTSHMYPDPVAAANEIRRVIRDRLGFTVNIGISRSKLLAKMASDFEKPDKVHTLFPEEIEKKLWPLPVESLFTVGEATASRLRRADIRTIGELAACSRERVCGLLGVKTGQQLHNYANGIDFSPVQAQPQEARGYSVSTTLEDDVRTREAARQVLLALSDSVSARIRADGVKAMCIGVTIRDNDFKNRSHQRKLIHGTDISAEIYQTAGELFDELWDSRTPLRLLGISLTELGKGEESQLSLFSEDERREKERRIDKAVDAIRGKFGADTIVRGSALQSPLNVGRKYKAQLENNKKL